MYTKARQRLLKNKKKVQRSCVVSAASSIFKAHSNTLQVKTEKAYGAFRKPVNIYGVDQGDMVRAVKTE